MYYALTLLSVVMFGGCFYLNDAYRRAHGSGLVVSLQYSLLSSLAGLIVLLLVNGLRFEFTPFTLLMALAVTVNGKLYSYCSFKALDKINLSLYSLFSMLGGMALPFLQGIVFYGEPMTFAKAACIVCIAAALALTVERGEKKRGGTWYYIGVFVFNGMSGVLSKLFTEAPYPKAGAAGYSVLICACGVAMSVVLLLPFWMRGATRRPTWRGVLAGSSAGALNKVANFILVAALAHMDASVQYPMVTGGVMIVSTALCFVNKTKPSAKELWSVGLAFVGMLALFVIPM
ncbi:MAG: hypothetical protein E7549_09500 [Ruminococcaceae bacterium]|nr:hypothetical protein [Oscillospiraceae bacterium]